MDVVLSLLFVTLPVCCFLMSKWIPAHQAAGIIITTFGTQAFQPRQKFTFCQQLLQKAGAWKQIFPTSQKFKHQDPSPHFPAAVSWVGNLIFEASQSWWFLREKLCVHQHFPSKFSKMNYFCQQLGAQEFLIHAGMAEKLLPVSDSFHSSVGPEVPILRVVIQIAPQTRLDVRDAY